MREGQEGAAGGTSANALTDGTVSPARDALEARLSTRRVRLKAVWLAVPFFLWFVRPTLGHLLAGAVLGLLGLVIRGWSAGTIRKGEELTTTGPYAYTRNPLYLGSLFLGLGITAASGYLWWTGIFLAFYVGVYSRTMRGESEVLSAFHGDAYLAYVKSVPAFVPRLTPYGAGRAGSPSGGGFTWARYRRNNEWEAAAGFAAVMAYLALRWWLNA